MARDVGNGFVLVTERTLQRLSAGQLEQLSFELEKLLREIRGSQPDLADVEALRDRNRRIQRLANTQRVVQAFRIKRRR